MVYNKKKISMKRNKRELRIISMKNEGIKLREKRVNKYYIGDEISEDLQNANVVVEKNNNAVVEQNANNEKVQLEAEQSGRVVPVFFACDNNFVKFTIVAMTSLMENASPDYNYRLYIMHTDIEIDMQAKICNLAKDNLTIEFVDVTEYIDSINYKLPIRDYYSRSTYYRFFIAEMFPEYDKAVYLDSDTIIVGDISELYNYDLGDNYVGACPDQAMIQVDNYGNYAEQVVGIDRDRFFNAGVMLINCNQFRKQDVLLQFIHYLRMYDFVVTQDEDYLNVICRGHVLFIEQQWNTEVFGEIAYPIETVKLFHYIMVSKPWHYEDCRLKEYFWKYAEKTFVYKDILAELHSYTDEQRAEDAASADRLFKMARQEIEKENNFLKLKVSGRLKAKDRLVVLDRIAELERQGKFDIDVEDDPPTKELMPEDIDYLRKKISSKIKREFTFTTARHFMNLLIEKKELIIKDIVGLENFKELNSGAIVTCNHFNAMDSFAIQIAYDKSGQKRKKRTFYRVIREGNYTNFHGFYGVLMRNCNTFPLSSNRKTMKKFIECVDLVLKKGDFMLFYPEQSMWWNYRKPKPLKKGAFTFAVRNDVPVLPCFITMEDSDILGKDGFYVQEYTIHICKPIYPDKNKTKAKNIEDMRAKNYEVWKNIYEEVYGQKLEYSCGDIAE